MHNTFRNLPE